MVLDMTPVKKVYIVHKVNSMRDTLFKLSFHYKISIKEIQRVNKISGDDIYYMTELLIPVKGDITPEQIKPLVRDPKQAEQDEILRREICIRMLSEIICGQEIKY